MAEIPTPPNAGPARRIAGMGAPAQPGVGPRVQTSVDAPAARDNLPAAIGGARDSVQLISALDGFVQSIEAVSQEMRNVVKEMHGVADQIHRYTEDARTPPPVIPAVAQALGAAAVHGGVKGGDGGFAGQQVQQVLSQLLSQTAGRTFTGLGLAAPGQYLNTEDEIANDARRDNQREQHRARAPRAPRSRGPVTTTFDPEHEQPHGASLPDPSEAEGHTSYERSVEAFQRGRHTSLADIRQKGSNWALRHLQNRQEGVKDRLGQEMADRGLTRLDFGGRQPAFTKVPVKTPGIVDVTPASAGEVGEAIPGLVKEGGMLARGASALEGVGSGAGAEALAGLLPEAAAGPVGWAAAAATLGMQGANMVAGQRAKNAQFQSIEGGSNISGLWERGRQRGFGLSQLGTMGGEEASRLFMGVTETGLRGGQRQGALDFASREYRKLGMSVDESVKLVQIATQNGETSFGRLGKAIEGVSKAAHEAGVNTDLARQQFIKNYGSFAPTLGSAGATTAAQASTQAMVSQGRVLANVDTSQEYSDQQLRIIGSQYHMKPGQVEALASGTQEDRNKLIHMRAGVDRKQADAILRQSGGGQILAGITGGVQRKLSDAEVERASHDLLASGRIDPEAARQRVFQMTGKQMDHQQAIQWLIRTGTGQLDEGAVADETTARARVRTLNQHQRTQQGKGPQGQFTIGDVAGAVGLSHDQLQEDLGGGGRVSGDALKATHGKEHDQLAYLRDVQRHGRSSPLIESLLKEHYDTSQRYVVDVGGKKRVVKAGELVSKYSDQAARGDVRVLNKSGEDQGSLSEFTKQQGDDKVQVTSDRERRKGEKLTGEDLDKYTARKESENKAKGGGHITVTPTPELHKWLVFMSAGGGAPSARSGTIPPQRSTQPGFGTSGQ